MRIIEICKRNKKRSIIIGAVSVVILAFIVAGAFGKKSAVSYRFGEVTKGTIESVVSSTGTLEAIGTVEVGTQISGTIESIKADFNQNVKKGQILVVLDQTMLSLAVDDAEANVVKTKAQYDFAQNEYSANTSLHDKGLISNTEFEQSRVSLETARAGYLSAQTTLKRAQTNLSYSVIRSPIDGTVIGRNIEKGQTVAASLSSPTLFIIAEDLKKMEIHALVDENDIGQIKKGQDVRFTVEAYPDEQFIGKVQEVRLQPTTVQNVVNYTVVIEAANDKGILLPGMTTSVDFVVNKKSDIFIVPATALSIQPTADMYAAFRSSRPKPSEEKQKTDTTKNLKSKDRGSIGKNPSEKIPKDIKLLWLINKSGQVTAIPVKAGISDGKHTEVTSREALTEGMQVIIGIDSGSTTTTKRTSTMGFGPPGRM